MAKLETLTRLLQEIYPYQYKEVLQEIEKIIPKKTDTAKDPNWYKHMILYVTYPDAFLERGKKDFTTLMDHLDYIKTLGCNAVHVLPFLESPMIDMGFDISDYRKVRKELGGNEAFDKFLIKAKKKNLRVFMDLVLNHCSFKHDWFQRALKGDIFYRDFFIWTDSQPDFIKKFKNAKGVWARYMINKKKVDIYVVFPEYTGKIPHWEKAIDGNWYYHTFYPHQPDINWANPHVFREFIKVIVFWGSRGVSFRLDAIQFIGRDLKAGKWLDLDKTHKYITTLNNVVRLIAPNSIFLNEVCADFQTTKKYFGKGNVREAELAYNFALMKSMWVSLIEENPSYLRKVLMESYKDIPSWAGWVTFLRNHDELSLESIGPQLRKKIYSKLAPKGLPFREGFGLSGRTASFFDQNPQKIILAHLLLASLPGSPAIVYGDEIGKINDPQYMKKQTSMKRKLLGDKTICDDTRDSNRGNISPAEKKSGIAIYKEISKIYKTRKNLAKFFQNRPIRFEVKNKILKLTYENKKEFLVVYVNLGKKSRKITIPEKVKMFFELNVKDHQIGPYGGLWMRLK